jgi:tRNA/tmRNA/rRNA uracil-C5-methylase (TrmA/RlmC/RlmD family)
VSDAAIIQIRERAAGFFQSLGVYDFDIVSLSETGWRTRVKLAVRRQGGVLAIGLFFRGTHEVLPIPHCLSHHPKINEAIAYLATLSPHLGYDEATATGQLRYVQLVVERMSQRVQATCVLNLSSLDVPEVKIWEHMATELYALNTDLWHSWWINLQPRPINTIFGPTWKHIVGSRLIWETLAGSDIPFLPSHFAQGNLEMFEVLLHDLVCLLPEEARVVELFAGMGVISLVIRPVCAEVTAIERDESAFQSFLRAKERLPLHLHEGIHFVIGDATAGHEALEEATTVIVDPPRRGLPHGLIKSIALAKNVRTLLYISCHFQTLERDVVELIQQGGFQIAFARSYLFFPGTDQIETLVKLVRN